MAIDLKAMAEKHGIIELEISGWGSGESITVKARRPSLYNMAAMGFIPNPIMGAMQAMFSGVTAKVDAVDARKQGECVIAMAKYALVEPTYQQIEEAGLKLTDDQLMEIYTFAIGGAAALAAFRKISGRQPGDAGGDLSDAAEPAIED